MKTVRHGVRTVLRTFRNDVNQKFWDTYGPGQLLPAGMKQLQDYGEYTMKRYSNFLNSTFSPTRVNVRSTGFDRTLQSTSAFLSGAFKPADFQKWTTNDGQTNWLPIPIHANDISIDTVNIYN